MVIYMEANPTTTEADALDELNAEIAAGLETVWLIGTAATFGGGACPVPALLENFTLIDHCGWVIAINDETGKEWTVEW